MGYTTDFEGAVTVVPPLNEHEIAYLRRFADTRRMDRELGPYYCGKGFGGQEQEPDIRDYNKPGFGQPGLWCKWEPTDDGARIQWNEAEKFYYAAEWMDYVISTFLMPGAPLAEELASRVPGRYYAPEFARFTFDHTVNGMIEAQGEDPDDVWTLTVTDNVVTALYPPDAGDYVVS